MERVLTTGMDVTGREGWAELEALIGCRASALLRRRLRERGLEPPV